RGLRGGGGVLHVAGPVAAAPGPRARRTAPGRDGKDVRQRHHAHGFRTDGRLGSTGNPSPGQIKSTQQGCMVSPPLDDFLKLAGAGNLIPVTCRILADIEPTPSAYRKIRGQGESFLFESVEGGEHLGRYSFVGCNPRAVIKQTGNRIEVLESGKVMEKFAIPAPGKEPCENCVKDGLEVVERVMKRYRSVALPGLPRFTGGAVGFIGYEFIHDVEPSVPRPPLDE